MFERDEVPVGTGQARGVIAPRVSLAAPLIGALTLSVAIAFLLSFAGAVFAAPRARSNEFAMPLDLVAAPFDGVMPDVAAPTVSSIEPASGSTSGGTSVIITGSVGKVEVTVTDSKGTSNAVTYTYT